MGESRSLLVSGKGGWINGYEKGARTKRALFSAPSHSPNASSNVECDQVPGRLGVKVGTPAEDWRVAVAAKATRSSRARRTCIVGWWLRAYSTMSSLIWPHVPFSRSFYVNQVLYNVKHLCLTFPRCTLRRTFRCPLVELPRKFLGIEKAFRAGQYQLICDDFFSTSGT